jgi:hypothetical protein
MRVSAIDIDGDWTFGRGFANYKKDSSAISQSVVTRLRSFTDDWFLNVSAGVDWFNLLGSRNNETRVLRAIERTVLQTNGVIRIDRLRIVKRDQDRRVTINLTYTDVFNQSTADILELPL